MLVRVEGVVLRTMDYGEGHKIVTLFTREQGKMGAVARGAKKPRSRLAAVTQPLTHGLYLCHAGGELATLSQGEVLHAFSRIRHDLLQTAYAAYILEVTDRLLAEREAHPRLFDQLVGILEQIEAGKDPEILTRIYELRALAASGVRPHLDACVACGRLEAAAFSVREGGFLCSACRPADRDALDLAPAAAGVLRRLARVNVGQIGTINVKAETKAQLRRLFHAFWDAHVGVRLKSRAFLEQLEAWADDRPDRLV
ncbi:DNA repair protein RecO [Calditerricola satsumensis]|uniref:DNA repair protein RecO n=3 Tax=Calditerricola satsumensis TaxID=373054 RepID=A0A8J3FDM6_9BACI|nr:DNA repair protein RecO [Calditerricola satsumensis]